MPVYDFCIAVTDEIESHRKKEGDVIAVRPHGWNWGRKEIDAYLIVPIECEEPDINVLRDYFERPLLENDHVEGVTFRAIFPSIDGQEIFNQYGLTHVIGIPCGKLKLRPKILGKNRCKIPLDCLGKIDLAKVRDKTAIYQPFLMASHVVAKFDGLHDNQLLTVSEVDCVAEDIKADEEKAFKWLTIFDQIVIGKKDGAYLAPIKKES